MYWNKRQPMFQCSPDQPHNCIAPAPLPHDGEVLGAGGSMYLTYTPIHSCKVSPSVLWSCGTDHAPQSLQHPLQTLHRETNSQQPNSNYLVSLHQNTLAIAARWVLNNPNGCELSFWLKDPILLHLWSKMGFQCSAVESKCGCQIGPGTVTSQIYQNIRAHFKDLAVSSHAAGSHQFHVHTYPHPPPTATLPMVLTLAISALCLQKGTNLKGAIP